MIIQTWEEQICMHALTLLQRRSSATVLGCHQIWFMNHCRCAAADNSGLSTTVLVLKLLLIIGIRNNFSH
jgi:hypothetical protein